MHPLASFRNRQKPRLSQKALAKRLGVYRETVARWEIGTRQIGRGSVPKIVKETGIPVGKLCPDLVDLE
jgi:transcriptional regulator with XRE-family HTH domain